MAGIINLEVFEQTIKDIIEQELGGKVTNLKNLSLGWSGSSVYLATTEGGRVSTAIFKTGSYETEPSFTDESDDNRVYGGRFSNLEPAYKLMVKQGISVPRLFSVGTKEALPYAIFEYLDGDTNIPEEVVGEEMGKLHAIERGYQGWVGMEKPYEKSWKDALFSVVQDRAEKCVSSSSRIKTLKSAIDSFVAKKKTEWKDPSRFVLSHTDGFQGMGKKTDSGYEFLGVIDLEDHEFTDPRFVLAGYELLSELWGKKKVSDNFWKEYELHAKIEESHEDFKSLFQLFYLLTWLPMYYDRIEEEGMKDLIKDSESFIDKLVNL